MKKLIFLTALLLLLTACTAVPDPTEPSTLPPTQPVTEPVTETATEAPDPISEQIDSMTDAEKVGQLFLARYSESAAPEDTRQLHLGGWILFAVDFENETGLIDNGILDSFDIVSLVTALNDAYDIEIKPNNLVPENFNSRDAILALVEQLQDE